jgi:hypothetical protein
MAQKKIAIVVPYRNREEHLAEFIPYMENYLSQNQIPFRIYIVEQSGSAPFNRGKLCNIGFDLSRQDTDYIAFHDVDMLPVTSDYSFAMCPTSIQPSNYKDFYKDFHSNINDYFGGVTLFNTADFVGCNGFPNTFWGWGCEDDVLKFRVEKIAGLAVAYRPTIFKFLTHFRPEPAIRDATPEVKRNQENLARYRRWHDPNRFGGLNDLCYRVLQRTTLTEHAEKVTVDIADEFLISRLRESFYGSFPSVYKLFRKLAERNRRKASRQTG